MKDESGIPEVCRDGDWKIGNYGDIKIFRKRDGELYTDSAFKYVAAHEFGHILGVADIYNEKEYADVVTSIFNVFRTEVQNVDVEMVLLAFATNTLIKYSDWLAYN